MFPSYTPVSISEASFSEHKLSNESPLARAILGKKKGAVVEYAIVAEESVIGENARVGASPDGSEDWGIAVVAQHLSIGPSAVVSPKAMITRNVKGGGVK